MVAGCPSDLLWPGLFITKYTTPPITTMPPATDPMIIPNMALLSSLSSSSGALMVGKAVGEAVNPFVGATVGPFVGKNVGVAVGPFVGKNVGVAVGDAAAANR